MERSPYRRDYDSSSLWNIFHGPCQRLYTAWNTSVRIAFDVPRETHRYLIEEISEFASTANAGKDVLEVP